MGRLKGDHLGWTMYINRGSNTFQGIADVSTTYMIGLVDQNFDPYSTRRS